MMKATEKRQKEKDEKTKKEEEKNLCATKRKHSKS